MFWIITIYSIISLSCFVSAVYWYIKYTSERMKRLALNTKLKQIRGN